MSQTAINKYYIRSAVNILILKLTQPAFNQLTHSPVVIDTFKAFDGEMPVRFVFRSPVAKNYHGTGSLLSTGRGNIVGFDPLWINFTTGIFG